MIPFHPDIHPRLFQGLLFYNADMDGIPSYILAGLVGTSRLEGPDDYYDIWDVLGGVIVGIGSTYLFTKPLENPKLEIGFSSTGKYKMMSIVYKF